MGAKLKKARDWVFIYVLIIMVGTGLALVPFVYMLADKVTAMFAELLKDATIRAAVLIPSPRFEIGDCVRELDAEYWQPTRKIVDRGKKSYLITDWGGNKWRVNPGYTIKFEWLDHNYERAECPVLKKKPPRRKRKR